MSATIRMGQIRVATDLSRVTYLSPILFLCNKVGEKVGLYEKKQDLKILMNIMKIQISVNIVESQLLLHTTIN